MPDSPPPPPGLSTETVRRNARYGLILFAIYFILYAGFIVLSAFHADLMAKRVVAGVNLAVIYGLGLIMSAFVLALIYMVLCRGGDASRNGEGGR